MTEIKPSNYRPLEVCLTCKWSQKYSCNCCGSYRECNKHNTQDVEDFYVCDDWEEPDNDRD